MLDIQRAALLFYASKNSARFPVNARYWVLAFVPTISALAALHFAEIRNLSGLLSTLVFCCRMNRFDLLACKQPKLFQIYTSLVPSIRLFTPPRSTTP